MDHPKQGILGWALPQIQSSQGAAPSGAINDFDQSHPPIVVELVRYCSTAGLLPMVNGV